MKRELEIPQYNSKLYQKCPFCGQEQVILVKGLVKSIDDDKYQIAHDKGYSFCNCRDVFFTNEKNVIEPDPCPDLKESYEKMDSGEAITITMPDTIYIDTERGQTLNWVWYVEQYKILWSMDSFIEYAQELGFDCVSKNRNIEMHRTTDKEFAWKKEFTVTLRKP